MELFTLLAFIFVINLPSGTADINDTDSTAYPVLFRDHVYYQLSEKGKEMFYAVNIHPACVEKKGQCIPRGKCYGSEMLYISRICYHHDLVCCYVKHISFPEVGNPKYTHVPVYNVSTYPPEVKPVYLP